MDLHLAELSRTIDPAVLGQRIRTARVAAAMTQAQVAAGEVTAAYLSRIEDGQRRPEASLLERMATRMGVSLDDLLLGVSRDQVQELQLAVDHAELSLVSGDGAGALRAIDAVLADPAIQGTPLVLRAAQQVRAGALEATGDLDSAIVLLEKLTASPTPDAIWLKGLIALSRCYRESGDYPRAINVGEQAQAIVDELGIGGLTEAIQLTVTTAGAYHSQGDLGQAMRTCMRALEAAERYDSPVGKASAYWNASIVEATRGSASAAIDLARKALALFELSDDSRNLSRLRATVANMLLLQDPPDPEAALEMMSTIEREMSWSNASAWDISWLHLCRGKAHFLLGDHDAALASVARVEETKPTGAPTLEAQCLVLEGRIAFAGGDRDRARSLFRAGVHALTAAGADRGAAQLWFELADLLAEVGDHEGAVEAFRSAGASTGLRLPSRTAAVPAQR
ncbi:MULTISPECIES: helix-turn-helix domain-containing protein [unclassified Nocardioides]|uniref:helix-turn-helix domain-containing protein n=1 Tax=unclassified Nocardioides TaxID=2615069 RepID=UPI00138F707F|nr:MULTISPECIES: helix-turn-helix domain-containing protein [unclassified Nocardioides]